MLHKTWISKILFGTLGVMFLAMHCLSCKKYLAEVPDDRFNLLDNLQDMQKLLDGVAQNSEFPGAPIVCSDDFYLTSFDWSLLSDLDEKALYIWQEGASATGDWNNCYRRILENNVILESLNDIPVNDDNRTDYERIKGSALFLRAYNFYHLAQLFAPQFYTATENTEAIPLRLSTDVEEVIPNSTVKQVYELIRKDCLEAKNLLPGAILFTTRPSRAAAWALLARTYLLMNEPALGRQAVDSSLLYYDLLYDYNEVTDPNAARPFILKYNTDVIFMSRTRAVQALDPFVRKVDSTLYNSYHDDDLRKTLFFDDAGDGSHRFKGDYNESENSMLFCGLAVDELYLIRAECKARLGDVTGGLDDLNALMEKRFKKGKFAGFAATTKEELLLLVLTERRKELAFRDTRWADLRRLNMEGVFRDTLVRNIDNVVYTLLPNDMRYVLKKPVRAK